MQRVAVSRENARGYDDNAVEARGASVVGASLASRFRRAGTAKQLLIGILVLIGVTALAAVNASIVEAPGRTALWAPAVGVVAALALSVSPRHRTTTVVAGSFAISLGTAFAGRPLDFAAVLFVIRVVELLLLCRLLDRSGRLLALDSVRRSVRYIAVSLVASTVFGAGVSLYRLVLGETGVDALALDALVAHFVAFVVITPIAFARARHRGLARKRETAVQSGLFAVAIGVVFSPLNSLPLAFLPVPLFAWAALRMSAVVVTVQLALVAVSTSLATLVGWGPFSTGRLDERSSIVLLQVYLAIFAGSTLVLWAKRVESEARTERAVAKDRLLRRAVEQAQTAFLLVERLEDAFIVVQSNDHGLRALGMDPKNEYFATSSDINIALPEDHPLIPGLAIAHGPQRRWQGELVLEALNGRADAEVAIERAAGEVGDVISVELTDVTEARKEDRRLCALVERERALSAQYQELSRQRDDFVASISHELRTPLASIVGYAELLDETELDSGQRRFVETIVRNVGRLQDRVEELLSAAKRAADSVDHPHPLAIDAIVGHIADDLRPVAAARRIDIRVDASARWLPEVVATEDAATRALTNIVANAVKFSPSGTMVTISGAVDDRFVEIAVADQGPGIAQPEQERVFERFYRTENATTNATPGTGLGLSIVRTLLEGIGGTVWVESDGAYGSTFHLRFVRAIDLDADV